jgi:hypothetical protein
MRQIWLIPILEKAWRRQFVEDTDIEAFQSIVSAGSTIASGIGMTHYFLNKNLNKEQKEELVRQTKTDYVIVEHLDNNNLMTDYFQNSDTIELVHSEKSRKSWYKFW